MKYIFNVETLFGGCYSDDKIKLNRLGKNEYRVNVYGEPVEIPYKKKDRTEITLRERILSFSMFVVPTSKIGSNTVKDCVTQSAITEASNFNQKFSEIVVIDAFDMLKTQLDNIEDVMNTFYSMLSSILKGLKYDGSDPFIEICSNEEEFKLLKEIPKENKTSDKYKMLSLNDCDVLFNFDNNFVYLYVKK